MLANTSPRLESFPPGTWLGERYRVEATIGHGATGVIVAAFDERLGRTVALKLLDPKRYAPSSNRQRFLREARAAAMLESEHVIRVFDAGVFDDAGAYLAMERLDGMDLRQALRERAMFSPEEAVEILVQTCRAVETAHARGVIHRDLKPANIFLLQTAERTLVKVLDFGISKIAGDEDSDCSLTDTGSALGSPRYMSPEQVRDAKRVGPASDIWALGVILYELVSGTTPFLADTAPGVYARIIADPPRPLRELRADVPAVLEAICARCLQKDATRRYPNVATLAQALASFANPVHLDVGEPVAPAPDDTELTLDPTAPTRPSRPNLGHSRSARTPHHHVVTGVVAAAGLLLALTPLGGLIATSRASPRVVAPLPPAAELREQGAAPPPRAAAESPPAARSAELQRPAPVPLAISRPPVQSPRPSAPPSTDVDSRGTGLTADALPRATSTATLLGSAAVPRAPCSPPFVFDPSTGTRRVKPGC